MRTKFASLVAAGLLALSSANASAVMLSLTPDVTDVTLSVPFDVTVDISGLGDFTAPSLSAYDLDIVFDPAVLMATGVAYGTELDVGIFGSLPLLPIPLPDGVNIAEISFEDPLDLEALQPGAFTLATITFDPLVTATGVTLGLRIKDLGDAFGNPLPIDMAVPSPATLMLAGLGLILTGVYRRRA